MDAENKSNPIEASFLEIIKEFEESYSGIFIKGVTDPEVIKKGDLEEIGKSLTGISEFLDNRLQDLEFPSEYETNRIKTRLERAVKTIQEIGNEIKSMKTQEPRDYHWYVVGSLAVVLISLFDYIEIYTDH